MSNTYDKSQLHELLYQALETEIGGIDIYTEALKCVVDDDLRGEWEEYLKQTKTHRQVLEGVLDDLSLDPNAKSPGREVVKHIGASLVEAMRMARKSASETDAELVAAECVVLAETKDHSNWELLGQVADHCGELGWLRHVSEQLSGLSRPGIATAVFHSARDGSDVQPSERSRDAPLEWPCRTRLHGNTARPRAVPATARNAVRTRVSIDGDRRARR
jgi:hypothetical protein